MNTGNEVKEFKKWTKEFRVKNNKKIGGRNKE